VDETPALRRSALAGFAGVALLAVSVALLRGSPGPGASSRAILVHLADEQTHVRVMVSSLLLVPGLTLLLWFLTGLHQVLVRLSGSDRLPSAVLPGAAVLAAAVLAGHSVATAPAATATLASPEAVGVDTYRLCVVMGMFLGLGGLAGAAVLVAATSRVAGEAGSLPLGAEAAGYVVALTCALGYFGSVVAVPLFLLWLAGACVAVWRASSRA